MSQTAGLRRAPTSASSSPSLRGRPRTATGALVVALAVVACRSEPPTYEPDLSPVKSGDRLRARWVTNTSGDVRYFEGWYDTELGVNCEWRDVEGTHRCLPPVDTYVYRDAACTEPAVLVSACTPAQFTAPPQAFVDCAPSNGYVPESIYEVGAVIDDAATVYWFPSGSDCVEQPQTEPVTLRAVGSEVPFTSFASAEIRRDYSGTRLAVDFLRAEDGSQEQLVTYDLELQSPCTPDFARSNGLCLPPTNVYKIGDQSGYFIGADCAGDELAFSSACEPTGFVYEFVQDGTCGYTSRYFERGAPWSGTVYTGTADACVEVTQTPYTFHEVGPQISESQFITLDARTEGQGRLRLTVPSYEGDLDVSVIRNPSLFDSELETECVATRMSDGSERCLPSSNAATLGPVGEGSLWGDAGCSETLLQSWPDESPCSPVPTWFYVSSIEQCSFGEVDAVYTRGVAWTGDVYQSFGTECTVVPLDPSTTVFTLDGPLPSVDFAAIQHVVE